MYQKDMTPLDNVIHMYYTVFSGGYMKKGTVKWFNPAKGFGFITPDDSEKIVFVHYTAIEGSEKILSDDDKVEFEQIDTERGPQADRVRKIS